MNKKIISAMLALFVLLAFCGCGADKTNNSEEDSAALLQVKVNINSAAKVAQINESEYYNNKNNITNIKSIKLSDSGCVYDSNYVSVEGNNIVIKQNGVYLIEGTLSNGCLVIDSDDKSEIHLIFSNVAITCNDGSPLFVKKANKVTLSLESGTNNTLSDSSTYSNSYYSSDDDEPDAALFSKSDLLINGSGTLTINAKYKDAVKSKGSLKIARSKLILNSADDAIVGKDYVSAKDAEFVINSSGNAIKSTSEESEDTGLIFLDGATADINSKGNALNAKSGLFVIDGNYKIKTDTEGAKGLKADSGIVIKNGNFNIDTTDDSIHSNQSIEIYSGTFEITSGDDALHADGILNISGGNIKVKNSYEGIEGAVINISGGNIDITSKDDGINAASKSKSENNNMTDNDKQDNNRPDNPDYKQDNNNDDRAAGPPGEPNGNEPQTKSEKGQNPPDRDENGPEQKTKDSIYKINISGGTILVNVSGDGLDSNGSITMTGGTVFINGPESNGDSAIDYETTCTVNGGTLVAVGSSGMAEGPTSESAQYSLCGGVDSCNSGTRINLIDSAGNDVINFTSAKSFSYIVISSPQIKKGQTYNLNFNDKTAYKITASSIITNFGNENQKSRPDFKGKNSPEKQT